MDVKASIWLSCPKVVIKSEHMRLHDINYTLYTFNNRFTFPDVCRVDLRIPEEDTVGGYSITSAPHQLAERGTINLAIQHSDHPPTHWMTTKVGQLWRLIHS